jgi:hypothetical protein
VYAEPTAPAAAAESHASVLHWIASGGASVVHSSAGTNVPRASEHACCRARIPPPQLTEHSPETSSTHAVAPTGRTGTFVGGAVAGSAAALVARVIDSRGGYVLEALGATRPVYAHLPMINGPDGKKLSKRHGAGGYGSPMVATHCGAGRPHGGGGATWLRSGTGARARQAQRQRYVPPRRNGQTKQTNKPRKQTGVGQIKAKVKNRHPHHGQAA